MMKYKVKAEKRKESLLKSYKKIQILDQMVQRKDKKLRASIRKFSTFGPLQLRLQNKIQISCNDLQRRLQNMFKKVHLDFTEKTEKRLKNQQCNKYFKSEHQNGQGSEQESVDFSEVLKNSLKDRDLRNRNMMD